MMGPFLDTQAWIAVALALLQVRLSLPRSGVQFMVRFASLMHAWTSFLQSLRQFFATAGPARSIVPIASAPNTVIRARFMVTSGRTAIAGAVPLVKPRECCVFRVSATCRFDTSGSVEPAPGAVRAGHGTMRSQVPPGGDLARGPGVHWEVR